MKRRISAIGLGLLAAALLAQPLPAYAQDQAKLDLASAMLLARDNSLAAQAGKQRLASVQAQRNVTVSSSLPSLGLQTSANYQELPSSGGLAALFGGSGGGMVGFPAQGATVDTTLSANQTLFDAFATRDALTIADYQIEINRLALLQSEQDAMLNAAVAYFQVLKTEALADVAGDTVKQAQAHLRLGELRFKAGTGTRADVLQLRAQLANAQGQLTQARNAVNLARLTLSNALNAPVGDRPLVESPAVPSLSVNPSQELSAGLERRTEVQQRGLQERISETQMSLESRAYLPTLSATGRYSQRGLYQGQFLAGLNLNWSLFDGFKARHRLDVAHAEAEAAQVALEQARQSVALEIRQQYQNREEGRARVGIAREGLSAAQEAYRLALKRFEVGLATPFEVTDVQTTLVQAQSNYIQAVNDLRVAEIRLARALGYDLGTLVAHK